MKIKIITSILLFSIKITFSNIGGMHHQPGINGEPQIQHLENTEFSIDKEILDLRFFRDGNHIKCQFEAKYYINNNRSDQKFVKGTFFGFKSNWIEIYSDSQDISTELDSMQQAYIDNLFDRDTNRPVRSDESYSLKDLSKKSFLFEYDSSDSNVMIVKGETILGKSYTWGVGTTIPSIKCRHPFINRNSGYYLSRFKYFITPIETWKSIGEIQVNVSYPSNFELYSRLDNGYNDSIPITNEKDIKIDGKRYKRFSFTLMHTMPRAIDFEVIGSVQRLFPGGPKIAFGKNYKTDNFLMRYGWEAAVENKYLDIHFSLDFDTDYNDYNTLALSTYAMSPWSFITFWIPNIGLGFGGTYNLNEDEIGFRLLHESSFIFFGFSGSYDYYPRRNNWVISLLGQVTF